MSSVESVIKNAKPVEKQKSSETIILRPESSAGIAATPEQAAKILQKTHYDAPKYSFKMLCGLSDVAKQVSKICQVEPEMAGQCVLATAALVTQHKANVQTLAGNKPLSLFLLTIADSGDGKSTTEEICLRAVKKYQREQSKRYQAALLSYNSIDPKEKQDEEPPMEPYLNVKDPTPEGIRRSFAEGLPSQGAFTSEAAVILSGYGMNKENKAKTAGTYNGLWDDGEISVARSGSARLQLYDRRFSKHFLIQPSAVRDTLLDPILEAIGYLPRFLVAWPDNMEPRKTREMCLESIPEIQTFWNRCESLLTDVKKSDCSNLPILRFSHEAQQAISSYFEELEVEGRTGRYKTIKSFALRATEQACRIAGVLTAFADETEISGKTMLGGICLASYSLNVWHGIIEKRQESDTSKHATKVYKWLYEQNKEITFRTFCRHAPRPRDKDSMEWVISFLELNNLIECAGNNYYRVVGKIKF